MVFSTTFNTLKSIEITKTNFFIYWRNNLLHFPTCKYTGATPSKSDTSSRNTSKLGGYHEQIINSTLPPTEGTIMMTSTSQSGNILGSKWKQISILQCGLEPATTVPSTAMSKQLGFSKQLIMKNQIKSWSGLPVQRDQEWWTVQDT